MLGDWLLPVAAVSLALVASGVWWIRKGGELPVWALRFMRRCQDAVDALMGSAPAVATAAALGAASDVAEGERPVAPPSRRSQRGASLRGSHIDSSLSGPLDALASRLGATRRMGSRGPLRQDSTAGAGKASSLRRRRPAASHARRSAGLDEDHGGDDGGWALEEDSRCHGDSTDESAASRPRAGGLAAARAERASRLYQGRTPAQLERVRRHNERVRARRAAADPVTDGDAASTPAAASDPGGVASPGTAGTVRAGTGFAPAAAAPAASTAVSAGGSALDEEVSRWLQASGTAAVAEQLASQDLGSASLLRSLARAGRLRDALREAGVGTVGLREALALSVESSLEQA